MPEESCAHRWKMINVTYGFVITEKCYNCDQLASYFTGESKPPLEEYRDGDHFWNVMESAQAFRFDMQCEKCKHTVPFDNLMWMMLCTGCDETCDVDNLLKILEPERTWVYVAFGFLPADRKRQLSEEQVGILESYYNHRRSSSRSKIRVVSSEMVKNIATCYGEVIKDTHMLSLTPPEEE